jgi:hypothetical protein
MSADCIRYTLISDGSFDKGLLPIIDWVIRRHLPECVLQPEWADLRRLRFVPGTLSERMLKAVDLYPCDVLFIHRDAEQQEPETRIAEIGGARAQISVRDFPRYVYIIPVRMTEAWLMFSERAIRQASGNPNGNCKLDLPELHEVETVSNPKKKLHDALRLASELTGRRRKKFDAVKAARRIVAFIDDFSLLLTVPAFKDFDNRVSNYADSVRKGN